MSIVYVINFTCPDTPAVALRPGEENGPGSGGVITTSLSLFGMGAQRWGEGVDEDLVHLLENFAANPVDPVPRDGFLNITLAGAPEPDIYTPGITHKSVLDFPIKGQMWYNKVIEGMMLYDGNKWVKMRGANVFPTPDPVHGDLWFNETFHATAPFGQLMVWDGTQWLSVANRYVLTTGDEMTGDLIMLNQSLTRYGTGPRGGHLVINEGDGDATVCPDLYAAGDMLQSADDNFHITFDENNNGTGTFWVRKGGKNILIDTWCMRVENDCTISVNSVLNYESLVTDADDIPNKQFVDNEIATLANIYLRLDGINSPMQGNVNWGNFLITNLGDAIADGDAVNRLFGDNRWVNKIGDQMTGTLDFAVDGNTISSICNTGLLAISAAGGILIIIDKDNNTIGAVDPFRIMMNGSGLIGSTGLMTVQQDGRILADTPSYEALVTSDGVLTNKKYVDDSISAAFVARTGGASFAGPGELPILVWGRDVFWTGTQLLMVRGAGSATTEIIFPAQYTP